MHNNPGIWGMSVEMKHPLRNSASGLASFLAATVLLAQPALAQRVYCHHPIKGPRVTAELGTAAK